MQAKNNWDIFCAVVDNYGDIAVCWRLARQLANEHGLRIRLWVDDLVPLSNLRPDADASLDKQNIDGVEVRHWPKDFPTVAVADIVIEAFACQLPSSYIAAMAAQPTPPVWINLEYLSAEKWVEGTHGLASPHSRLPLNKYFFFPGFTHKTGGLLRERDYEKRAAIFDESSFRTQLNLPRKHDDELTISLFGYENAAQPRLLDAWAHHAKPITCLVPESRLLPGIEAYFGQKKKLMQRGQLSVHAIPFLPQDDYDALLWLCDLNFVRGEDSFIRAHWAAKHFANAFVWHIYPQDEAVHLVKLEAFLDSYLADMPQAAANAARNFWLAWNSTGKASSDISTAWSSFAASLSTLRQQSQSWSNRIATHSDLASNLRHFVEGKSQ